MKSLALYFCLLLISATGICAQEFYGHKPGTTISYEVEFHGKNADEIRSIQVNFSPHTGNSVPQKEGYVYNFSSNANAAKTPGCFDLKVVIPSDMADGLYHVVLTAFLSGGGSFTYSTGFPTVQISGQKEIGKPTFTVEEHQQRSGRQVDRTKIRPLFCGYSTRLYPLFS